MGRSLYGICSICLPICYCSVVVFADDDIRNTLFQFRNRTSKADDRHDFACDGNAKAISPWHSVHSAAESDDAAQFAVVEIDVPLPRNRAGIYFEFVAVMNVIIDQSRNQIVCYGNRMDIAGKVQIDFFHRNNLRPSATARTTLYAEAGA